MESVPFFEEDKLPKGRLRKLGGRIADIANGVWQCFDLAYYPMGDTPDRQFGVGLTTTPAGVDSGDYLEKIARVQLNVRNGLPPGDGLPDSL